MKLMSLLLLVIYLSQLAGLPLDSALPWSLGEERSGRLLCLHSDADDHHVDSLVQPDSRAQASFSVVRPFKHPTVKGSGSLHALVPTGYQNSTHYTSASRGHFQTNSPLTRIPLRV